MRYRETGELHKDFHGATNATIDYVAENFGESALREIFFEVGKKVYRSIHENLMKDSPEELVEHLDYFFGREGGQYRLTRDEDTITLEVDKCPAVEHVLELGLTLSPHFCRQTIDVNEALCDGTPWKAETTVLGCGKCRQVFRRRDAK